jgi:hypothetical protein
MLDNLFGGLEVSIAWKSFMEAYRKINKPQKFWFLKTGFSSSVIFYNFWLSKPWRRIRNETYADHNTDVKSLKNETPRQGNVFLSILQISHYVSWNLPNSVQGVKQYKLQAFPTVRRHKEHLTRDRGCKRGGGGGSHHVLPDSLGLISHRKPVPK